MLKTNRWEGIFPVLLVILMLASRIPMVTSNYFKADGDEAIVGLMAKEIVDHGDFKIYFWGQQYGFVTFETSVAALSFKLFGVNAWSLKLAMLLLWIAGGLFLYEATKNISGYRAALIFELCLVVCPAWGLWSMKARGGYMTAWFFSGLIAWILSVIYNKPGRKLYGLWLVMGVGIAIIYYAQKLWLLSLIPFVVTICIKRFNIIKIISAAFMVAISCLLINYFARHEASHYWPYASDTSIIILSNIPRIIPRLIIHFSGAYYIGREFYAGWFNAVCAMVWLIIFVLAALVQVYRLITRKFYPFSHLCFLAACLSAVIIFTTNDDTFNYRYLLPIDVPLILGFALECDYWLQRVKWKMAAPYAFAVFIGFNLAGLFQLRNISTETIYDKATLSFTESMKEAIDYCKAHQVYYTFASDAYVFWQTDFYSNNTVMSRFLNGSDRNPEYVKQVTAAYLSGKPVAILDSYYASEFNPKSLAPGIDLAKIINFGNQIRVYMYPERKTLEAIGFDLK